MRAANPQARREALTSRPLLLAAVGRATSHGGQTTLYLTPMHAGAGLIKSMIANVHAAIQHVRQAAEQLPKLDQWAALLAYICRRIVSIRLANPASGACGAWVTAVFRINNPALAEPGRPGVDVHQRGAGAGNSTCSDAWKNACIRPARPCGVAGPGEDAQSATLRRRVH